MAKLDAYERFLAAATDAGITVEPVRYPDGTRTAVDAAASVGCDVSQIVKSLVVVGPDGPALALTAGHHRVDLDLLSVVLGGPTRMSDANEALTECHAGRLGAGGDAQLGEDVGDVHAGRRLADE